MSSVCLVEEKGVDEDVSSTSCPPRLREIWRRIQMEYVVELPMLKTRWKILVMGAFFQYVHGIFTQVEHRLHEPRELLTDTGFLLLPELDNSKTWVSETIFVFMFVSFIIWMFSPFFLARKRFYTVVLFSRLLMVLMVCQALRIVSFLSTQLPGPHYHCRMGEPTAKKGPAEHWWNHLLMNPLKQSTGGCGDLIFSSHTTFILVGVLTYNTYGEIRFVKALGWIFGVILSLFIIASRKHYTVDIVVAWYTVPLVFYHMHRRWTTHRDMRDEDSEKIGVSDNVDLGGKLEIHVTDGSQAQKSKLPYRHLNVFDGVHDHKEEKSSSTATELMPRMPELPPSATPVPVGWSNELRNQQSIVDSSNIL